MSHCCYIGLGSNLNNPARQITLALQALRTLPGTRLQQCSPRYGSKAIGPGQQADYINAVAELTTTLTPQELLTQLQAIEQAQGRRRELHWGPRNLDLDILLYDDKVLTSETLTIPHPRLRERPFVIYPLHDIAPDLLLPDGTSLKSLLHCPGMDPPWRLPPQHGE